MGVVAVVLFVVLASLLGALVAKVWMFVGELRWKKNTTEGQEEWETMGPIDATQFFMDVHDTTCVNALVVFESEAEEKSLQEALSERFVACNPRMRGVLEESTLLGIPQLRILDRTKAKSLVQRMWRRHERMDGEVPDREELEQEVAQLMGKPLVKSGDDQPLWEAHYWPVYERDISHKSDGPCHASAMLLRYHHGLADGVSALRAVMLLCDYDRAEVDKRRSQSRRSPRSSFGFGDIVRFVLGSVKAFIRVSLLPADNTSALHPPSEVARSGQDVYSCSFQKSDFSVSRLKEISRAIPLQAGVSPPSINDLLLTALSGALREALLRNHAKCPLPKKFTTTVWVSLSPVSSMYLPADDPKLPHRMSNKNLALVYVTLPLRETSALARLHAIQKQTSELLRSPEPLVSNLILKALPLLPARVLVPLATFLTKKTSVSMSNVPGPQFPISVGGTVVDQLCFFVAPQGYLSIFVCIMSYNDKITVGVGADSNILTAEQAREVVGPLFEAELSLLAKEAH